VSKSGKKRRTSAKCQEANVVHTTIDPDASLYAPQAPSLCTDAVALAEERYERLTQGKAADRASYLRMRNLLLSPDKKNLNSKTRHRLLAMADGECWANSDWWLK
jgi:hypothetical protein